jgi:hypothetical protein
MAKKRQAKKAAAKKLAKPRRTASVQALATTKGARSEGGLTLPSGRSVAYHAADGREELEIRSASGQMELRIALTSSGPVLSLSGVRLEVNSSDEVAVNCREFVVNAQAGVSLRTLGDVSIAAAGEARLKSGGKTHLDAEVINLNCGDRTGYPDEQSAAAAEAIVQRALRSEPEPSCGSSCSGAPGIDVTITPAS